MTTSVLEDTFAHHVWATIRLIDACSPLSKDQLGSSVTGIYGPIIDTMRHLVGGDRSYLWVITRGAIPDVDEDALDLAAMRVIMEENGPAWQSLVASDLDPEAVVIRHRDDGSQSLVPLGIRLAQAVQHGNDHRSQVCTALTNLGIEPPDIDVMAFAREDGRVRMTPAEA